MISFWADILEIGIAAILLTASLFVWKKPEVYAKRVLAWEDRK